MDKIARLYKTEAVRRTLAYYWLIMSFGLAVGLTGPTLPALAAQVHTSLGTMGQMFLVGAIGGVLGTVLGGRLLDRVRSHTVLGVAQIASGVLLGLIPSAPALGVLLAVVFTKGIMDGIVNSGVNTLIIWTHREKVSPYMNALHFFFGLGAFLSPLLVAQVIEIPGAYRWLYIGLAVVAALAGLRVLTLHGSPRAVHPPAEAGAPAETAPSAAPASAPPPIPYAVVITAALFLFFYVGAEIAFGGWIYTYAVELNLASVTMAAYLTSGFWLTFTVGRLLSVPIAIRFRPRKVITASLLGCLFFMGLMGVFHGTPAVVWVSALGVGFCMAPVYPSGFTLAVQGLTLSGRATSIIVLGDSFGAMVLPWMVGQVLGQAGPRAMVYLVLASLLCDVLAFVALLRARARLQAGKTRPKPETAYA